MEGVRWPRPTEGVGQKPTTSRPVPKKGHHTADSYLGQKPDTPKPSSASPVVGPTSPRPPQSRG